MYYQLDHLRLLNWTDPTADDRLTAGAEVDKVLPEVGQQRVVQRPTVQHQRHVVRQPNQVVLPKYQGVRQSFTIFCSRKNICKQKCVPNTK